MTELRRYRQQVGMTQPDYAKLLGVPLNSFRKWDSGLRPTPRYTLVRAQNATSEILAELEPLNLPTLAKALKVHVRTLQHAARTGRLEVRYSTRSVFGRPQPFSTRAAGKEFLRHHYKRYAGQFGGEFRIPTSVPPDYRDRLRTLRSDLKLSQAGLAERIGAANKAVVYQWESGKRVPSHVFWARVAVLRQEFDRRLPSAKMSHTRP